MQFSLKHYELLKNVPCERLLLTSQQHYVVSAAAHFMEPLFLFPGVELWFYFTVALPSQNSRKKLPKKPQEEIKHLVSRHK